MRVFWMGMLTVALVWALLQRYTSTESDRIDNLIVTAIAAIFALASLVMIAGTFRWSIRAFGLLCTSLATAIIYGTESYTRNVSHRPPQEPVLDLARAMFIVGGPLLLFGLISWIGANWNPSKRVVNERDYVGPERRGDCGGRRHYDPPYREGVTT